MRLFLAISVPEVVKKYLASIYVPGRRVSAYHLTLAFLGEAQPEAVLRKLDGIRFSPLRLELYNMGCFPNIRRPRVVWVGIRRNDLLYKLQGQIAKVLNIRDKFHPHITLSRLRRPDDVIMRQIEPLAFDAFSFELFRSTLTQSGPVYSIIKTFKSTGPNPGL